MKLKRLSKGICCLLLVAATCISFTGIASAQEFAQEEVIAGSQEVTLSPEDTSSLPAPSEDAVLAASTAVSNMTTSEKGIAMIKTFEGFVKMPGFDHSQYSIGYGTSCNPSDYPNGITEAEADVLMRAHLATFEAYINQYLANHGIGLNQAQFDAIMDFTYNCGTGWVTYKNSDGSYCMLRQLLELGVPAWTDSGIKQAFGNWNKAGGAVSSNLTARRTADAVLFLNGIYDGADSVSPFTDVAVSSWYFSYVTTAKNSGLLNGNGNGTFRPESNMTRAEFVMALSNLAAVPLDGYSTAEFTDVASTDWFMPAVAWAVQNGICSGYSDGSFGPNDDVTREQMCVMLHNFLLANGFTAGISDKTFTDMASISGYAVESVNFCVALDIINGYNTGEFNPAGNATRAQVAKVLVCAHEMINNNLG